MILIAAVLFQLQVCGVSTGKSLAVDRLPAAALGQ